MIPCHNQPVIDKCIVSFSHSRFPSRQMADQASLAKARREIAEGKKGISHLILRASDDRIDRLKFLFLIHGIPIMCYALENLLHSSLKEIVVIGSREVKQVLDRFLAVIGSHGKSVTFAEEDSDNLSLINTLNLGRTRLSYSENELILFQPGDLPFMYDIEKVLMDSDITRYNLILWLNSRQKMFPRFMEDPDSEFVQRNYHYRTLFEQENELHDIKEPNIYPINLSAVESDIIELLHTTRKDGKIFKAGIRKALTLPSRFLRLAPVLARHALHFRSDLKKFRRHDRYQFGMARENFERGGSILLNTPLRIKLHDDPAFVSDVDALEDWEDFEALTGYAQKQHGDEGLSLIHPAGDELLRFRDRAMPELKQELPIYADFPAYMNKLYRTLEMGYEPYDAGGRFLDSRAHAQRVSNAFRWYSKKCESLKVRSG